LAKNDTMWEIEGIAASPGIAIGHIMHIRENFYKCCRLANGSQEMKEKERFLTARQAAEIELATLQRESVKVIGKEQRDVWGIQNILISDLSLVNSVLTFIKENHASAEMAVENTTSEIFSTLIMLDNDYMMERAGNIKEIGKRLLRILQGTTEKVSYMSILVAQDLLPDHTAILDLECVSGLITALGGKDSHKSILARNTSVPIVAGISNALEKLENGDLVIIDGHIGRILVNPVEWVVIEYEHRIKKETKSCYEKALNHLANEI
jgi:phosphotransferase system enzyme I (PtsI)